MNYKAKTHASYDLLLTFQLFLISIVSITMKTSPLLYILSGILIVFLFSSLFLMFHLTIENDIIKYKIYLFSFPIYKKDISSSTILKINFVRRGWSTKTAIIKQKSKFPIRLMLFQPQSFYTDLLAYCEQYHVEYKQSKDFLLLMKLDK
ncbi:hypothetical protein [Solibacillus sp. FSL K6-1523]|uniref:hypothetical protein n=1 Tax=Solibacillus sp. FSL K6-1523 TaxID=2921471 RepID=UPI0030F67790